MLCRQILPSISN